MAIDPVPLDGLDLNHLVTLRALLREGSVTRAAERLGQTQPTVSRVLAQLRTTFDDPLLVRSGRGMKPTPRAESLVEPLERCLAAVDRLAQVGGFDPATSGRAFRLLVPDLLAPALLPGLLQALRAEAPGVRLHVLSEARDQRRALLHEDLDLVVGAPLLDHPEFRTRALPTRTGWTVVLGRRRPQGPLDRAAWLAADHAQITPNGRPELGSPLDERLAAAGLDRRVVLTLPSPAALAEVLVGSDLIATLPAVVARGLATRHDLTCVAHPLDDDLLPPLPLRLTWAESQDRDPGQRWLRGHVARALEAALQAG